MFDIRPEVNKAYLAVDIDNLYANHGAVPQEIMRFGRQPVVFVSLDTFTAWAKATNNSGNELVKFSIDCIKSSPKNVYPLAFTKRVSFNMPNGARISGFIVCRAANRILFLSSIQANFAWYSLRGVCMQNLTLFPIVGEPYTTNADIDTLEFGYITNQQAGLHLPYEISNVNVLTKNDTKIEKPAPQSEEEKLTSFLTKARNVDVPLVQGKTSYEIATTEIENRYVEYMAFESRVAREVMAKVPSIESTQEMLATIRKDPRVTSLRILKTGLEVTTNKLDVGSPGLDPTHVCPRLKISINTQAMYSVELLTTDTPTEPTPDEETVDTEGAPAVVQRRQRSPKLRNVKPTFITPNLFMVGTTSLVWLDKYLDRYVSAVANSKLDVAIDTLLSSIATVTPDSLFPHVLETMEKKSDGNKVEGTSGTKTEVGNTEKPKRKRAVRTTGPRVNRARAAAD